MTVDFRSYQFAAAGSNTLRTYPERLNDTFNVKDWGPRGDGFTDDGPSIQAAIDYAFNTFASPRVGGNVFIPPGIYFIANPPVRISAPSATGGQISFVGAGMDATIIKGNYSTGVAITDVGTQISGMSISGGVVTATTPIPHRLAVNQNIEIFLSGSTDPHWLPGITTDQIVFVTVVDPTHFRYSNANTPGAFDTASWNYPSYSLDDHHPAPGPG